MMGTASVSSNTSVESPPVLSPVTSPLCMVSRKGRDRQRFAPNNEGAASDDSDGKIRLVAGSIPVRKLDDGTFQVLMITNKHNDSLIFPKGGWETDETSAEAAARETMEEAGALGVIAKLDDFTFESKMKGGKRSKCCCSVYVMTVTEVMEVWPESSSRTRNWYTPETAIKNCKHAWMRDAMRRWGSGEGFDLADGWTGKFVL
jgi:diphosphoinositol-polyphosphate diphosphatase|mmetsp:Transcript_6594/g.22194  ORF Transcript_6594/g.22194 Transcript_6594/m.22194 type:complete len:203 (-) Transcript_6594:89-697(-)